LRGLDFTGKITFKNFKKEVSIFDKTMTCCPECGHPLEKKFLKDEGDIPYCSQCASFRFPVFNTAISAILFNEKHDKILLIKQYDMAEHILLAGYVSNDIHNQFLQSLKPEMAIQLYFLSVTLIKLFMHLLEEWLKV